MTIKEFLIENYIWLIVIILITIITVIGFLADKSKGNTEPKEKTNKKKNKESSPPPVQNQENSSTNLIYNNNDMQNNQVNQSMQNIQNNQEIANGNNIENQTESINNNIMNNQQMSDMPMPKQEEIKPLSEQKPNIPPQPVPNYSNMSNNRQMMNPINNNFNGNMQNYNQNNGTIPSQVMPTHASVQVNSQPMMANPMNNGMNQNYNNQMKPQQPVNNNFNGNMQNYNQNNATIPSPVMPIPAPMPVNPQPIMYNAYNQTQSVGAPLQNQPLPNMNSQQQSNNPTPQNPVNFVFGPQNNNQNM